MIDRYKNALSELTEAITDPGGITYAAGSAGYNVDTGANAGRMTTGIAYNARLSQALGGAIDLLRANRHRVTRTAHTRNGGRAAIWSGLIFGPIIGLIVGLFSSVGVGQGIVLGTIVGGLLGIASSLLAALGDRIGRH